MHRPEAPCTCSPTRYARSGRASCSRASSGSRPSSPPKDFSRHRANGRCRSCRTGRADHRARQRGRARRGQNARRRWPAVRIAVREVAVQGPLAVTEVCDAISAFDRNAEIDVIVIARGGGSLEDLLPVLGRGPLPAVAARSPRSSAPSDTSRTPRSSTSSPTSGLHPDRRREARRSGRRRAAPGRPVSCGHGRVGGDRTLTPSRPVSRRSLSRPALAIPSRRAGALARRWRRWSRGPARTADAARPRAHGLEQQLARLRSLSPAATLARGTRSCSAADGGVCATRRRSRPGNGLGSASPTGSACTSEVVG